MWKMKLRAKLGKTQGPVLQCKYAFRAQGWASLHKDIFIVLDAGKSGCICYAKIGRKVWPNMETRS